MRFVRRVINLFKKQQSKEDIATDENLDKTKPKNIIMSVGEIVLTDRKLLSQEEWDNVAESEVIFGILNNVDIKKGVGAVVITDNGSGDLTKKPFLNAKFNVYDEGVETINKNLIFTTNEYKIIEDNHSKTFVFLVDMDSEKGSVYHEIEVKK